MAIHSQRSYEGYLLIDHRASPGTPSVPEGQVFESALHVCHHCQRNVILNPDRSVPLGRCPKCARYICRACEATYHATNACFTVQELIDACGDGNLDRVLEKRSLL
jgi:hypothetical protein